MHRLAGFFVAFIDPVRIDPFARPCAGQEPDGVRRGLDEERARRHRRRLYREDRRQDRRQLCRKLGARQTDRTGRAGGYFHLRRHRLDGLCDRQEEHQRADAGQSARQQHGADRAEGFQDRQCRDRAGLRSRKTRRRRQDRHRRRQSGAGRQIRQGGAGEARRVAAAAPKFAMAENVRAALALVARGEAVLGIVYSTDAKVEPGVKIVGTFPADSHPAIIYPVAATATAKAGSRRTISPSCARRPPRPSSRNTASRSSSARQPERVFDISPTEWTAIQLSLRVAAVATLVATPLGIARGVAAGAARLLGQVDARCADPSAAGAAAGRDRLSAAADVRQARPGRRVARRPSRHRVRVPLDRRGAGLRHHVVSAAGAADPAVDRGGRPAGWSRPRARWALRPGGCSAPSRCRWRCRACWPAWCSALPRRSANSAPPSPSCRIFPAKPRPFPRRSIR